MKNLNRRELCVSLSAFAALSSVMAEAQAGAAAGPDGKLSKSVVFNYDQLPVKNNANGGTGRQVLSGTLPTGEFVEVHETTLPAGKMPHPPHKHSHSEFLLIREGNLEFINDGKPEPVGPGRRRLYRVQRDARPQERRNDDGQLLRRRGRSANQGKLVAGNNLRVI